MFRGTSYYTNNTSLFITDLGDVDSNNVLCMTDLAGCCTDPGRGEWIYSNGNNDADGNSLVGNNRSGDKIFRTRGDMVVRLERRNNPIGPTGQYCCQVPTMVTPDTDSTMCVILSEFHGVTYGYYEMHVSCTYVMICTHADVSCSI